MKTLVINTYAGSLLLGAGAVPNSRIVGSFEDSGFGANITKANRDRFSELEPDFVFVDELRYWPDHDLTDTVVLAHPPCAAFSQQNTSKTKRGVNTEAFDCTRKVLRYAMGNGAAAIAVESVMGALRGAADQHEHFAESGGYHLFRILKNSILFGVPQFRERFWAVFVRKDLGPPTMTWFLAPRFVTVGATLDPLRPGTPFESLERTLGKFVDRLGEGPCVCGASHGFDPAEVREVGLAPVTDFAKRRGFARQVQPRFFPDLDPKTVLRHHVSPFTSAQPSVLSAYGYAPVLLGSSLWIYDRKPVTAEGYKAIMGFPTDYIFPEDRSHGMRTYLSKGVCPPVATWVLANVREHVGVNTPTPYNRDGGYVKVVEAGAVADFRPSRKAIDGRYELMRRLGSPEDDEPIPLEGV